MRAFFISLLLVLSTGLFVTSASAQNCSSEAFSEALDGAATALSNNEIVGGGSGGFDRIYAILRFYEGSCPSAENLTAPLPEPKEGLALSLEGPGQVADSFLEDVEIPTGMYRVELVTNGYFLSQTEEATNGCGQDSNFMRAFNGQGTQGVEFLFRSYECHMTLKVSARGDWRLDFYLIPPSDLVSFQEAYSSETDGVLPVIGPVRIPDGSYIATLVSEGSIAVNFRAVSGRCVLGHDDDGSRLFVRSPTAFPQIRTALTSDDCIGYILFSIAERPWTLTFEPLP